MRFSVELSPSCDPADISEHTRVIEGYGFYRIWVRDMITVPWELWTALSTVVLSSSRVRVGIDVANPYTRSPVVMAHGAVTMDRISKGRLDLGFGGGIPRLLESMGIKKEEGALQECVGVVRSLLGGGKTTFSGNTFKINEVELPRLPCDKDIPIYVAAMDEKGFRVAREVSDGVLTISANAKFLRRALEWISGGSDAIPLGTWLPFSLSKEKLFTYLQRLVSNLPQGFWALTEMDKDRLSREELVDTFAVCGEGDLREKIERLENLGISEIIFEYMNLTELEALEFFLRGYQ